MYKKNKGFTIVELIVVMAIIAILILMAVPKLQKYIEKAKLVSILATADTIHDAAVAYEAANITDPNLFFNRRNGYIDFTKIPTPYPGTYILVFESYLDPYISGDVLFTQDIMSVSMLSNNVDTHNIFTVGMLPTFDPKFEDPIVVGYSDPRMPTREEALNVTLAMLSNYTDPQTAPNFTNAATYVVNGVPMVVGSSGTDIYGNVVVGQSYYMVPVTEYLKEYNKALKEIK